ncbi:MAG: lysozyme, partial [Bacteroidetes bacterium]|nr:lysozyme [Bacteroidota bacterium]
MKIGIRGLRLIKKFEGCKLTAYTCPAGLVTIGYGNTFYKDGSKIKLGDKITQQQAEDLLMDLLPQFEAIVNKN